MRLLSSLFLVIFLSACGAASPAVPEAREQAPRVGAGAAALPVAVYGVAKGMWVGFKTGDDEEIWVHALEGKLEAAGFQVVRPYLDRSRQPALWLRVHLDGSLIGGAVKGSLEVRHYDTDWDTDEGNRDRYFTAPQPCGRTGAGDPKIPEEKWNLLFAEACATVLVDTLVGSPQLAWSVEHLPTAFERGKHENRGFSFSLPGLGGAQQQERMQLSAAPAPVVAMRGATAAAGEKAAAASGTGIALFSLLATRGTDPATAKIIEPVIAEVFAGSCLQPVPGAALAAKARELGEVAENCMSDICWVRIAGEAGAGYYVSGALAKVGEQYLLSLRLMDAKSRRPLASLDEPCTPETLVETARAAAAKLAAKIQCK